MKKFALATFAVVVISGPALAAPPAPFNWSGFYAGGNGGYASSRDFSNHGGDFFFGKAVEPAKGAIGGFQWGWLGQSGNIVFGYESTWDFGTLKSDILSPSNPLSDRWHSKIDMLTTSVARFGYSMGNWLPYVKAGWAWGHVKSSADCDASRGGTCGIPPTVSWTNKTQWQNGGTVGAGLDVMLAANWILGVQYDYIALSEKRHRGDIPTTPPQNSSGSEKPFINMVTGRLSYKFGAN